MLIVDGKRIRISVKEEPRNPLAEILKQFFIEDLRRKRITKEWVNTIP
jgi:hypothetical protein